MAENRKVCFIGGGAQGCQNSLRAVANGYETWVYDVSGQALDAMVGRQRGMIDQFMAAYGFSATDLVYGVDNIRRTTRLEEACEGACLVNESLPERMELKLEFYPQLERMVTDNCLLTTNTSSLPITPMSKTLRHPSRFAALHFNGFSMLADVMPAQSTLPETIRSVEDFSRSIGLIPITLGKDVPGYLSNNILIANFQCAALLAADKCASIEDIDRAMMMVQTKVGPFAMMDMIGLDVCRDVLWEKAERTEDQSAARASAFIAAYIEKGHLGAKSGKGFYSYPDAPWQQAEQFLGKGQS